MLVGLTVESGQSIPYIKMIFPPAVSNRFSFFISNDVLDEFISFPDVIISEFVFSKGLCLLLEG